MNNVQLVIRNGNVCDGTGNKMYVGDVVIDNGIVVKAGPKAGANYKGKQEIDATNLLVTPGFVDIHTHYDGQVTWDQQLSPSCYHGVTTTVFGNCGVGFAPIAPGQEQYLINLMEGVEDIPGSVLNEGMEWGKWSSFKEYLDYIDTRTYTMDVAAQIPHGALRFFVMGQRGINDKEIPTEVECKQIAEIVKAGLDAGALGISTSRTYKHRTGDRNPTNMQTTASRELLAIAEGMKMAKKGVLQVNGDWFDKEEWDAVRDVAATSGRPVNVLLFQVDGQPMLWNKTMHDIEDAQKEGLDIWGQVAPRPVSLMHGFEGVNPFVWHSTWRSEGLSKLKTGKEIVDTLRNNHDIIQQLINEHKYEAMEKFDRYAFGQKMKDRTISFVERRRLYWENIDHILGRLFELDEHKPNYEPKKSDSVAARAIRLGIDPWELLLRLFMKNNGSNLLMFGHENFHNNTLEEVKTMLSNQYIVSGSSDAGAHCGAMADAGMPTYLLTHWGRDREHGQLPLEFLVRKQTRDTAVSYGLKDRGVLIEGFKGDVNVIDFTELQVLKPTAQYDLPAGGKRLVQLAKGFKHTFVNGVETFRDGKDLGARPGKLVRGTRDGPGLNLSGAKFAKL